jgi:uncharacterized membrane protein
MEVKMKTLAIVLSILAAVILGAILGGLAFSSTEVVKVNVPQVETVYVAVQANSTAQDDAANLILKDDRFEAIALTLATDDLEAKNYKELYNFLVSQNVSIDEKEDISKVVIKDSDVSNIDADEQDADVDFELKVYFEDLNGDNVKIYVDVATEVVDGDVEDVVYTLA